jgi:hypothetical protein
VAALSPAKFEDLRGVSQRELFGIVNDGFGDVAKASMTAAGIFSQ